MLRIITRETVIYWLSVPAITDSANKCHVFGGHFNPKSLTERTLTCDRQFVQMSMLPSGDRKQYFISRVLRDEPRDCGNSDHFGYISFTTSRHKNHVFYFKPAKLKKRTILSFDQCASCRALAVELVRQNTNSTYRSKQSGHKEPSGGRPDMKYFERQKLTYVDYKCSPTVRYLS